MQAALKEYGYGVPAHGEFDELTAAVVTAFQRHFRPAQVDGIADHSTLRTLERLLASRPA
jgi:N-acetylmuramoyl-L-alanine amidase